MTGTDAAPDRRHPLAQDPSTQDPSSRYPSAHRLELTEQLHGRQLCFLAQYTGLDLEVAHTR